MDKRKEIKFEPEKQIDFVKLIDELDWTKEISPVSLVKAANKVGGLKGRRKYETNEVSFGALIKSFERRVGSFVDTRFHGKDRFYTLKPEFVKEQLLHFAKTGEFKEIKKELEKKAGFTSSITSETKEETKKGRAKVSFPDNEALAKTIIMLCLLRKGNGNIKSGDYHKVRELFGWRIQRYVDGKLTTNIQEARRICTSLLELEDPIYAKSSLLKWNLEGDLKVIDDKIKDLISLMDDEDLKQKVQDFIKPEEKVVPEVKAKPEPERKPVSEKPEPKKPVIVKASPVLGKSEFKDLGFASPAIYESSKQRWNKSLIAATMKGAERGVWYNFNDISVSIKKTRFVEISPREIKEILVDVSKQFKGVFREIDFGGVTIGSEVLMRDFYLAYPQDKITETIFVRLKLSLEDFMTMYPELKVSVASEIDKEDNIFEIEMNRAEKTEKAFCRLVYKMRPGEIILESQNNWVVKRTKTLIEKYIGF